MRTRIWMTAAGTAVVIAAASGVALAETGSPSARPSALKSAEVQAKLNARAKAGAGNGKQGGFFTPATVARIAQSLHVSTAVAQRVSDQIRVLAAKHGGSLDSRDPAFAAIARTAGVSVQQLVAALDAAKMAEAQ